MIYLKDPDEVLNLAKAREDIPEDMTQAKLGSLLRGCKYCLYRTETKEAFDEKYSLCGNCPNYSWKTTNELNFKINEAGVQRYLSRLDEIISGEVEDEE